MSKVPPTTIKNDKLKFQRELLAKLKVLAPGPGQVLILELPQAFFDRKDPKEAAEIKAFADAIARATGGRDVFAVPEGRLRVADEPPKLPEIQVPKPKIVLPHGVQI